MPPRRSPDDTRIGSVLYVVALIFVLSPVLSFAEPSIPLSVQLAEVDQRLKAREPAAAADLLDEILRRVEAAEKLPAGLTRERLLLVAANTRFELRHYPRAAELALALENLPGASPAAVGEARLVRGLALALQEKYAEAIPVFHAAEDSPPHRDKALLYRAMSAVQAGELPVATAAYKRLIATSPRDRDWADAALALIDLHLRAGSLADARRGLALLRGNLALVDNLAGLNLLLIRLGDAMVKAGDHDGALAAFRQVTPLAALLSEQKSRNAGLERALAHYRGLSRPSAADTDAIRRLHARLEQAWSSLEEIEKLPSFDAALRQRLAHAFQDRGDVWEAALLHEDLIASYPDSAERETAYFALVRAYADAGRLGKVRDAVERFVRAFPESKFGPQALYLAATAAGQRNDLEGQLRFLDLADEKYRDHDLVGPMRLLRANALFALARHAEARKVALGYLKAFPKGKFTEEARYLAAMADLAEGRATEAEKQIRAYLKAHPKGRFVPDARYRLAATAYSREDYASALELCDKWLAAYPAGQSSRGEVHSLRADALVGLARVDDAIPAYHDALQSTLSDEQLGYVLDELTRHYQARRDYDAAVSLWERFAAEKPDHPYVINAAYWIGRLRGKQGRFDEAIDLVAEIVRRHVKDPARGDLERVLVELAVSLSRPPHRVAGEPKPEPVPETALFARADELLLVGDACESPTARARALFTRSEIAALRENPALRDELLGQIAAQFAPNDLPPGILGKVGDAQLAQGQSELAKTFYAQILSSHAKSIFADFGHVGLGEIALRAGRADEALGHFTAAIDQAGARFKQKEATLGRARAQLLLDRPELARPLLEEVAANRSWRGEATAEALYLLGEIAFRRGTPEDLAKAQAHYQRVYLSYKRYPAWVAKAYLRSAEAFEKLGQDQEALTTLNRLLTFRELEPFPEWRQALALKPRLEARVPAAPAATIAAHP